MAFLSCSKCCFGKGQSEQYYCSLCFVCHPNNHKLSLFLCLLAKCTPEIESSSVQTCGQVQQSLAVIFVSYDQSIRLLTSDHLQLNLQLLPSAKAFSFSLQLKPSALAFSFSLQPSASAFSFSLQLQPSASAFSFSLQLQPSDLAFSFSLQLQPSASASAFSFILLDWHCIKSGKHFFRDYGGTHGMQSWEQGPPTLSVIS